MLLSTAIPIVIAAIVIVIMSRGISSKPIIPNMKKAAMKFGTTPIKESFIFLNNIKNIANMPNITKPNVRICDLNKLCNRLLNKIDQNLKYYQRNLLMFLTLIIYFQMVWLIKLMMEEELKQKSLPTT